VDGRPAGVGDADSGVRADPGLRRAALERRDAAAGLGGDLRELPVLVAAPRERVARVEGFLLQLLEPHDRGRGAGRAGLDGVAEGGGLVAELEERLARLVGGLGRLALPAAGLRQAVRERRD